MLTRAQLAAMIDHTLLKPEATITDLNAFLADARQLDVGAVCVSPTMLPLPSLGRIKVATVCGFPSGAHHSAIKAAEAARATTAGTHEIDMVINVGHAVAGEYRLVKDDIDSVRQVTPNTVLKVIIESAVLTDKQIVEVCQVAEDAGADFVKTSTGFHPAGGASLHAVELMAKTVDGRLGVKASGGIRTTEQALAMVAAGATRLGLSASATILEGLD